MNRLKRRLCVISALVIFGFIWQYSQYRHISRTELRLEKNDIQVISKLENASTQVPVLTTIKIEKNFDQIIKEDCDVEDNLKSVDCLDALNSYDIDSFELNENLTESNKSTIFYHTFWHFKWNVEYYYRVMTVNIMSYLVTQDLVNTRLILWILDSFNVEVLQNLKLKFEKYLNKNVLFKIPDFNELCSLGPFKRIKDLCLNVDRYHVVAFSDFIRLLVLYKYRGIYIDGDVIFLRNMKPFWHLNFAYRWSFTNGLNTAVMGLSSNYEGYLIKLYNAIIDRIKKESVLLGFHPMNIAVALENVTEKGIFKDDKFKVFHSALFDPIWLCNDGFINKTNEAYKYMCIFDDIFISDFNNSSIKQMDFNIKSFFPGAFTYHLHMRRQFEFLDLKNTSYFYFIFNYFESKLNYDV